MTIFDFFVSASTLEGRNAPTNLTLLCGHHGCLLAFNYVCKAVVGLVGDNKTAEMYRPCMKSTLLIRFMRRSFHLYKQVGFETDYRYDQDACPLACCTCKKSRLR